MIARAFITVCLFLVAMSPAAIDAFSQISQTEITSGVMDLQDNQVLIYAVGVKDGLSYEIKCRWVGGQPKWIVFSDPKANL